MSQSEKYSLQWDNFQNNMTESFKAFKASNMMFDVTLSCDDKATISAHKIILSACSPLFQSILNQNNHSHPWIYLKGIKSTQLNQIIDFVYSGVIDIASEEVQEFLEIAKELQIKGLTNNESHSKSNILASNKVQSEVEIQKKRIEHIKSEDPLLTEPSSNCSALKEVANIDYEDNYEDTDYRSEDVSVYTDQEECSPDVQSHSSQMVVKVDDMWQCCVCQKTLKNKSLLMKHTETHIEGVSIQCEVCRKLFRSNNSYQVHMSDYHTEGQEGMSYTCNICWKICKSKPALRMHNNRNHKQASIQNQNNHFVK